MSNYNKTKVTIYYGPRKEFEKIILKKRNRENFTTIVQEHDEEIREVKHYVDGQKNNNEPKVKRKITNLIINSDEYSMITEGALQNFISILEYFNINNVFIQNPPVIIADKIKKIYKNVQEIKYEYKYINISNLRTIKKNYENRIIGQDSACKELLRTLLSFDKLEGFDKPLVIMFYGPSGVGKTEMAKFLSEELGEELFYKQFSMFQNQDFATYLFGGNHSQNSFSKELLDRNSNIILLDEFDKANNYFYSAFYQLFDEGKYVDKNYSVELNKSVIICTSNYLDKNEIREKLGDPIFFRFDAFIKFNNLSKISIEKIVDIKFEKYLKMLNEEDKNIVCSYKIDGIGIKDTIKYYSEQLVNARKIDVIVKDFIMDVLLEQELKNND